MAQPSSYGPSTNSALSGVNQDQISQSQSTEMLTYNSNSTLSNNNMEMSVETPTGENTYVSNNTSSNQVVSNTNQQPTIAGAIHKEGKSGKAAKQQQPRKPPPTIDTFWPTVLNEVQHTAMVDSKHQSLPLARIKKIMKLDENAKMIAAEAPLLFAKACEFFIQELTMRAWIHTDESKRRTLQRSDIAQAIANYDQFDFLIDIVPREDIKPPTHRRAHQNDTSTTFNNPTGANNPTTTTPASNVITGEILNVSTVPLDNMAGSVSVNAAQPSATTIAGTVNQQHQPTQVITTSQPTQQLQIIQQAAHPQQQLQYFITLPGQQNNQTQLVHQLQLQQQQQQQHINNGMGTASLNLVAQQPHQLILTSANPTGAQAANVVQQQQQAALLQNLAQQHHQQQQQQQQQQQVQFLQHVVLTPNGELANMPIAINANQLQLLRLQMQQQQQHQQQQQQQQQHHIIPTHLLTAQQILQLQAAQQNNNTTTHIVHHQPQQQQQPQQHPQTNTSNIYINSNPATASQASSASMVSTDRNLGSTFRNNC